MRCRHLAEEYGEKAVRDAMVQAAQGAAQQSIDNAVLAAQRNLSSTVSAMVQEALMQMARELEAYGLREPSKATQAAKFGEVCV